jgi:carboxypeptidase C (cathepsin A)
MKRSLLLICLSVAAAVQAQPLPNSWEAKTSATSHTIDLPSGPLKYTAHAGYLPISNANNEVQANMFYVSYTKDGADPKTRPVMFGFNGGPGSSTVWLHMGVMGPKMANFTKDGSLPKPPYEAVVNRDTWLEDADIVCIDAPATGLSRLVSASDRQYFGVQPDIAAFGEFIRTYLTKYNRWRSPLFIAGESYGGIRAGGLCKWLLDNGIALSGVIVVSGTMNYQNLNFGRGNDQGYVSFLPTYAATAWYHKKLNARLQRSLEATVNEARKFVEEEYVVALNKGDALTPAEKQRVAKRIAELTGLSETFVMQTNLRIRSGSFFKELLRDRGQIIGRLDGRLLGTDALDIGNGPEYDPSSVALTPPYVSSLYDYLQRELNFPVERKYNIYGSVQPWDFGSGNGFADTSEQFRQCMNQNPHMKVLMTCGYFDMACPFYGMEYTVNHIDLKPELRKNIEFTYYEAGHMMYIEEGQRRKLKQDVASFIARTLK